MAISDPSITNIIDEKRAEYDLYFENAKVDAISQLDAALAEQNAQLEPDQQKSPEELAALKDDLAQFFSTSRDDFFADMLGVLYSAIEKAEELGDAELVSNVRFKGALRGLPIAGTAISIGLDVQNGDDWQEAVTKEVTGLLVGMAAGAAVVAGAAVLGALGAVAVEGTAAAVIGALGAGAVLAVEYLSSNWTVAEIGEQWDYYLGPNYDYYYDEDRNTLTLDIKSGKVSDALRNYWQGGNSIVDKNILEKNLDYQDLNEWTITQITPGEIPLEISFDNSTGNFYFIKDGITSLRQFSGTNEEFRDIVNRILEKSPQNFNVAVGGEGAPFHQIENYFAELGPELIASEVLDYTGDTQKKALYALVNLYAFVEEGVDDYSSVNPDNYSDQYIRDRAAFLYFYMHEGSFSNTPDDMQFYDAALGIDAYAGNGTPDFSDRHYIFGNLEGELIEGNSKEDHLYGMDGDDILKGNGGGDILVGGFGSDTMDGGTGNDTFIIHGTDPDKEAFDTFNGGDGTDTILGGALNNTIRVNSLSLSGDSIEIIDGGAGVNVIAGTDGDNTIDLTGMAVQHIARIEGGAGQDTLVGTEQDDVIYGSVKDENSDGSYDDWAPDYLAGLKNSNLSGEVSRCI